MAGAPLRASGMPPTAPPERTILLAAHSSRNESNMAIVSSGPPADSGWNCTPAGEGTRSNQPVLAEMDTREEDGCGSPQTFLPDSTVVLMPSTDESWKRGEGDLGQAEVSGQAVCRGW